MKPDWITQHQIDVLRCVTPGPLGLGLTITETAKKLGVTTRAIDANIARFKETYPQAWERVASMKRAAARQGRTLRAMSSLDSMFDDYGIGIVYGMIKQVVLPQPEGDKDE